MTMRVVGAAWAAGLALTLWTAPKATAAEPKVGDPAPAFRLDGSDGKPHALADLKGRKPVVVAWYPKASTKGCTAECKSLGALAGQLEGLNVAVFGASVDGPAANRKFAEDLKLSFPLLSDPEKSVAKAYGVLGGRGVAQRWTFYIDKEGVIRHIDKAVKPASHGADVVAKLKELGLAEAGAKGPSPSPAPSPTPAPAPESTGPIR